MGNELAEEVDHEFLLVLLGHDVEFGHVHEEGGAVESGDTLREVFAVHQVLVVRVVANILASISAAFDLAAFSFEITLDLIKWQRCLQAVGDFLDTVYRLFLRRVSAHVRDREVLVINTLNFERNLAGSAIDAHVKHHVPPGELGVFLALCINQIVDSFQFRIAVLNSDINDPLRGQVQPINRVGSEQLINSIDQVSRRVIQATTKLAETRQVQAEFVLKSL